MGSHVIRLLWRQKLKSSLVSSGFLIALCMLLLLSSTTQTAAVQGSQIINQNWRSTYDLVVLPSQANIPAGQTIPPDFFQQYDGGISIQQYEQIKRIPGIEVAAPIAYIGYITLPAPAISFPGQNIPSGYYRLTYTLTAFNGVQTLTEYQSDMIYEITPCGNFYDVVDLPIILDTKSEDKNEGSYCEEPTEQPILSFPTPQTGTFLLAAIDPEAENRLLGLNAAVTSGRGLSNQDVIHPDTRIPSSAHFTNAKGEKIPALAIPMLINEQPSAQLKMTAKLSLLTRGKLTPQQLREQGGEDYLLRQKNQQVFADAEVPLVQNDPGQFANATLAWNDQQFQLVSATQTQNKTSNAINSFNYLLMLSTATNPAGVNYQPTTGPDGKAAYTLVPTGTAGPEVAYRYLKPLKTLKIPHQDVVYTYEQVGTFEGNKLASQFENPLNWLPENTYSTPPVTLRYDSTGKVVPPTKLLPTTNQAGHLLQAPLALTTLKAARELKGDRIISAIRVRVSGVEKADEASWKRIQQVAAQIQAQTGLQVLITLGSSPSPTLVYLPGINKGQLGATETIAPLGWAEERWISVGVSILYLSQFDTSRLLLLSAVLLISLGYLFFSVSSLLGAQRPEFAVLSALGWRSGQLSRCFFSQTLILALFGGGIGIGLAVIVLILLGSELPELLLLWSGPGLLGLVVLGSLYPLWKIRHLTPAEMLRGGVQVKVSQKRDTRPSWNFASPGILVLRNLMRTRLRTLVTIGSLLLSSFLLVVTLSVITTLRQTLQETLLGDYVLLQIAIPQIAGSLFTLFFTGLRIVNVQAQQIQEREAEIALLQATGWRRRQIQTLFLLEGLVQAGLGILPGMLMAILILASQKLLPNGLAVYLVPLTAVVLLLLVTLLATLPARRSIKKINLPAMMRAV